MLHRPLVKRSGAWTPAFEQSVICDGGASMTRTFTSTSGDSWAIALRRSKFGAVQNIISGTVYFDSSDRLVAFGRTSTRVFRDIGWYVFLFNPISMYVNNRLGGMDEVTGTGTYAMASIVNPVLCGTANRFEGAIAAFWHGDSVAWSVSDFVGSFTFDGQSLPIALSPSLTYGADGVRLLMQDSANFGTDTSGNTNNWTPTGFVAGDQTADVPGRPYAVWNAIWPSTGAISDGGRTTAGLGTSQLFMPSGKLYWEITANAASVVAGVVSTGGTATTTSVANGTTSGFRFDADAGTLDVTTDGVNYTSVGTGLTGGRFIRSSGGSNTINSGLATFTYTPPTGFLPLHAGNLPTPDHHPQNYVAVGTRTGTGAAYSVTNGPANGTDYLWGKGRSAATDHYWYDIVRGVEKQLESNTTTAETTEATGLTAFNATGYSGGALAQMNTNLATYVDLMLKAGGAPVANTDGTIASTVSVAAPGHFGMFAFTGTGANATVGHGLPGALEMVIVRRRNVIGNWPVYHKGLSSAGVGVFLNLTDAQTSATTLWNSTAPSGSVVSVGTSTDTNQNTTLMIGYAFRSVPGVCKVGSYIGNGSADGPLIDLGFTARWILIKQTNAVRNWFLWDTARDPFNVVQRRLFADTADQEFSGTLLLDVLSSQVKIRSSNVDTNASGGTYIYLALADICGGGELPWPLAR